MGHSSVRRPVFLAIGGGIISLVFIILGGLPPQEYAWGRIAHDVCASVATVFFAVAVGGGLVELWQRREWNRRTQWILPDLLHRAMRETAIVASRATKVVEGSLGKSTIDSSFVADVLSLPWTDVSGQAMACVEQRIRELMPELHAEPRPQAGGQANTRVVTHDSARATGIEEHADKLWALSLELASYIDDRQAPVLLTRAAALHGAARALLDPFPERRIADGVWPALSVVQLPDVLHAAAALGRTLSDAYDDAERRVSDDSLKKRFELERRKRAEADDGRIETIRNLTASHQVLKEARHASREFAAAAEAFHAAVEQWAREDRRDRQL